MDTTQIYSIVNDAVAQAIGEDSLASIDTKNLVSLGSVVLSSSTNTECFLNTLAQRIGKELYHRHVQHLVADKFKQLVVSSAIFLGMRAAREGLAQKRLVLKGVADGFLDGLCVKDVVIIEIVKVIHKVHSSEKMLFFGKTKAHR